jgi:hypothetical protein
MTSSMDQSDVLGTVFSTTADANETVLVRGDATNDDDVGLTSVLLLFVGQMCYGRQGRGESLLLRRRSVRILYRSKDGTGSSSGG